MQLAKQIKKYRSEMNLSQEELADKVFGVSLDILVKGDIENMKKMINEAEVKKYNTYGNIFGILFVSSLILFIPLVKFLKIAGIIVWVFLYAITMVYAIKVQKIAKANDVHTYKEVVAFMEGKTLEEVQKQQEIGKRPYQNVLKALFGAVIALVVLVIMNFIFKVF